MAKKVATASEIQAEMQRRIRGSPDLDGRCRDAHAPMPSPAPSKARYGDVNWTIYVLPGVPQECIECVMKIVVDMMQEYDLG